MSSDKPFTSIDLMDGKYKFFKDKENILRCKRYGEDWQDFTGDHAVTLLFEFALEMANSIHQIKEEVLELRGNTKRVLKKIFREDERR